MRKLLLLLLFLALFGLVGCQGEDKAPKEEATAAEEAVQETTEPDPGAVFSDGFESGDTTDWSSTGAEDDSEEESTP